MRRHAGMYLSTVMLAVSMMLAMTGTSQGRSPVGSIQTEPRGSGKELIVDINPGETLRVTATFSADNRHQVRLYESNNHDIDQISRSGEHVVVQNPKSTTRTVKITDWYWVASSLKKTWKMRVIDSREDYLKVGTEDGTDDDYNDAVIEVSLTRSNNPGGGGTSQDYNRGFADGYQRGLAAGAAQCGGSGSAGSNPTGTGNGGGGNAGQNGGGTTGASGRTFVPDAMGCLNVAVTSNGRRAYTNNCSYDIHITTCTNERNFGAGGLSLRAGDRWVALGTVSPGSTFNYVACPSNATEVDNVNFRYAGNYCSRSTGQFSFTGFLCKR